MSGIKHCGSNVVQRCYFTSEGQTVKLKPPYTELEAELTPEGLTASKVVITDENGDFSSSETTSSELLVLGSVTPGTASASKSVVLDANSAIDEINTSKLSLGASGSEVEVTSTATELNTLDITASGTAEALKAIVLDASKDIAGINDVSLAGLTSSDLTASTALVSDGSKKIVSSSVTSTELGHVSGVTSAIQDQINAKSPIADPTFTGEIGIGEVNVSETELGILEGATVTTAKLNTLDVTSPGTAEASKALVLDASKDITGINTINGGTVDFSDTNSKVGFQSLSANTTGIRNTGIGNGSLSANSTGSYNTGIGSGSLSANSIGSNNTGIGRNSLSSNSTGTRNTGIGSGSLSANSTGSYNTAIGYNSFDATTTYSNCSGLGYNTAVTGDNQVQLGNSSTTTYAYGSVQDRSDIRDKADIQDMPLGLEFINALRPVQYRWDYREDYKPELKEDATEEEKAEWIEACKLANIEHDGTHKRSRFHNGLIAQEVKDVMDTLEVDFAGYQDHSINGGDDVKSLAYNEFIPILIKAIQTLDSRVKELELQV